MKKLMSFLAGIFRRRETELNNVVEQVIDRVFERIWQRVVTRVLDMPLAEARGYVRARAALVLLDALGAEGRRVHLSAAYAPAMDATIQRVLIRVRTTRDQAMYRRAA